MQMSIISQASKLSNKHGDVSFIRIAQKSHSKNARGPNFMKQGI